MFFIFSVVPLFMCVSFSEVNQALARPRTRRRSSSTWPTLPPHTKDAKTTTLWEPHCLLYPRPPFFFFDSSLFSFKIFSSFPYFLIFICDVRKWNRLRERLTLLSVKYKRIPSSHSLAKKSLSCCDVIEVFMCGTFSWLEAVSSWNLCRLPGNCQS